MFKKLNNSLSFSFTLIFILILICSTSSKASCVFNCPKDDESSSEFSSNEKGKRYFEDQPDLNDDYQIHFIYMLDKDGKDNEWDINGKMQKELEELNEEMFLLTGNKQKYKFDYRTDGKLDITFIRLDRKGSSQGWNNSYADYFIQKQGFNNPKKLYYVWADVVHSNGGQMGVHSGYTFLKSRHNDGKKRRIQITMHELLHGQGFAWKCTDGNQNGHVFGPSILSIQNNANLLGNMIYNHNNTGCPDLKDSVYLTPTSDEPYDPLPMVCHLAERSGRAHGGSYGFGKLWPSKYNHKKFENINKGSYWCTYKLSEFANENYFRSWSK